MTIFLLHTFQWDDDSVWVALEEKIALVTTNAKTVYDAISQQGDGTVFISVWENDKSIGEYRPHEFKEKFL